MVNKLDAVMLTGGNEEPVRYAKVLAGHDLNVHALIAGPEVAPAIVAEAAAQFSTPPRVFVTNRPEQNAELMALIHERNVRFAASCYFEYRVRLEFLNAIPMGVTNVHPSVLPHNGGMQSPFWAIMEETPVGATLHWMNEAIDKGDIIDQIVFPPDDLRSATEARRLARDACVQLYDRCLPLIITGTATQRPQGAGGRYHFAHEIKAATRFKAEDSITFDHLLKLVRATDYAGHGFYVEKDGKLLRISAHVSQV